MGKIGSYPDPRRFERSAKHYAEMANSELDPKRREQLRSLAADQEREYRRAMRTKA